MTVAGWDSWGQREPQIGIVGEGRPQEECSCGLCIVLTPFSLFHLCHDVNCIDPTCSPLTLTRWILRRCEPK